MYKIYYSNAKYSLIGKDLPGPGTEISFDPSNHNIDWPSDGEVKLLGGKVNININSCYLLKANADIYDTTGKRIVKKNDYGGFIWAPIALPETGKCWVYRNCYVIEKAKVYDNALIGADDESQRSILVRNNAQVYGNAQVYYSSYIKDNAQVYDNAVIGKRSINVANDDLEYQQNNGDPAKQPRIKENAKVYGSALVSGYVVVRQEAQIYDNAIVGNVSDRPTRVSGSSKIYGNAIVNNGSTITDEAEVFESAKITGRYSSVSKKAKVYGNALIGGARFLTDTPSAIELQNVYDVFDNLDQNKTDNSRKDQKTYLFKMGALITDESRVYGNAYVGSLAPTDEDNIYGPWIAGKTQVYDNARIYGYVYVDGEALINKNAIIGDVDYKVWSLYKNTRQHKDPSRGDYLRYSDMKGSTLVWLSLKDPLPPVTFGSTGPTVGTTGFQSVGATGIKTWPSTSVIESITIPTNVNSLTNYYNYISEGATSVAPGATGLRFTYDQADEDEIIDSRDIAENGYTLIALRPFGTVSAGNEGGKVHSTNALLQEDETWVRQNSDLFGNSYVRGKAVISEFASMYDNAKVVGDVTIQGKGTAISGNAEVNGSMILIGSGKQSGVLITDNAKVTGNGTMIFGKKKRQPLVCDNARIGGGMITGELYIGGDIYIPSDAKAVIGDAEFVSSLPKTRSGNSEDPDK